MDQLLPTLLHPPEIVLDGSPTAADIAIVSVFMGNPAHDVMEACGYSFSEFPKHALAEKGFHLAAKNGHTALLLIGYAGDAYTANEYSYMLTAALSAYRAELAGKRVWVTLPNMSKGELDLMTSYHLTTTALNNLWLKGFPVFDVLLSLPSTDQGKHLKNLLDNSGEMEESEAPASAENGTEHPLPGYHYYLGGGFWGGENKVPEFLENSVWQNGYDDKYQDLVKQVPAGSIFLLKSTYAGSGISYLRIKAVGQVRHNPGNGTDLEMEWLTGEFSVDVPHLGWYRDAIHPVKGEDVRIIFERLEAEHIFPEFSPAPLPPEIPKVIQNQLKQVNLVNDASQTEKDLLGFENDIRAFASLIALKELQPPLAIALFGRWGSGKSFFMHNLQKRIEQLCKHQGFPELVPANTPPPANDAQPFCQGVAHITFNAWSYMDANLWASLAATIFEKLDEYIKAYGKSEEMKREIRKQLSEQLTIINEKKEALVEQRKKLEAANEELRSQLKKLEEKRKQQASLLTATPLEEIKRKVEEKIPLEQTVKTALGNYGIRPEMLKGLSPDELYTEATSWVRFVRNTRQMTPGKIIVLLVCIILLAGILTDPGGLITTFVPWLKSSLTTVISLSAPVLFAMAQAWRKLQKIYEPLREYKNRFNAEFEKLRSEYETSRQELFTQLQSNTEQMKANNLQIASLEQQIQSLQPDNDDYVTRKAFEDFIGRKSADTEYKSSLSIVSTIRKDFEVLSNLLADMNGPNASKDSEQGTFGGRLDQPLNRIVLYIDDLDRCPEERVIEVLEAVNLLMAYRLFVVVVGVDPRWVKNSLVKKFTLQFTGIHQSDRLKEFGVQPIRVTDYLEKIFQIPFHLSEAQPNGVAELLDHLFDGQVEIAKPVDADNDSTGVKTRRSVLSFSKDKEEESIPTVANEASTTYLSTKPLVHFRPEDLKISSQELQDLKDLAWLIGNNPRAIKRYANIYRVVRAHENLNYSEETRRGDFLAVMFILGLSIGQYRDAASAFYTACRQQAAQPLPELMASLPEELALFRNAVSAMNLPEHLKQLKGEDYLRYIPFVKRFSFESAYEKASASSE